MDFITLAILQTPMAGVFGEGGEGRGYRPDYAQHFNPVTNWCMHLFAVYTVLLAAYELMS